MSAPNNSNQPAGSTNTSTQSGGSMITVRAPPNISTLAAKEFSLEDAVLAFGLKFTDRVSGQVGSLEWCIEDIPETKDFVCSPCLSKSFKHSRSTVDLYLMVWLV